MLSGFTHSLPSDIQPTAHCCSDYLFLTLYPRRLQLHQITCFLLCCEVTGVKGEGNRQGRKWLYKQLPWLRAVKAQGQEREGSKMLDQGLHKRYHFWENLLPLPTEPGAAVLYSLHPLLRGLLFHD